MLVDESYEKTNEEWFEPLSSFAKLISNELCIKLERNRKWIEDEYFEELKNESDKDKIKNIQIIFTFEEFNYYRNLAIKKKILASPQISYLTIHPDDICVHCKKLVIKHTWKQKQICQKNLVCYDPNYRANKFLEYFDRSFKMAYDNSETNHTRLFGKVCHTMASGTAWGISCKNYAHMIFKIATHN